MTDLPPVCSFWHGRLGWFERLCMASFVAAGHRFTLFAYDDVGELPAGCTLGDAGAVVPRERMFFYKGSRTPAVFADLFRLELMRREAGIWVDCDVYCLRPLAGFAPYVFGIEADGTWRNGGRAEVNNAVFRCPADCHLLDGLFGVFAPGATPPGMPIWRRLEVAIRRGLGENLPVENMQFGATGPWPLNHYVRALGLQRFVQPRDVFYPLAYERARRVLEPGSSFAEIATGRTLAIHLWHSALTRRGSGDMERPAPGSALYAAAERLGISIDS